ncbi:MAG: DEAD/DEAH box helicase [Pirellulales bacterium]
MAPSPTLRLTLSPHGRLSCEAVGAAGGSDATGLKPAATAGLAEAFANSSAAGLVHLAGLADRGELPADLVFWRGWGRRLVEAICQLDEDGRGAFVQSTSRPHLEGLLRPPDELSLAAIVADAAPMRGLEYLSPAVLRDLWFEAAALVRQRAKAATTGLSGVLAGIDAHLHLLGRVTFHLAENRRDPLRPFAFLATYTHRLSEKSAIQHLPLAQAVEQSVTQRDQATLTALLTPVRAAADRSGLVREWLDSRALFTPRSLTIVEAHRFLRDVPVMEESGLVVRVPDWWRGRKPPRPTVQVRLGNDNPAVMGLDSLLDFSVSLCLDGDPLTATEAEELLAGTEGLVLLRGRWVEMDRDRLRQALAHWQRLERAHADGIDFVTGMRLLAGADSGGGGPADMPATLANWTDVSAGDWLRSALEQLRDPAGVVGCTPGTGLATTLRPYQADGVRWLWFMTRLRLGGCLADDMGLGKTIQLIDLLLRLRDEGPGAAPPAPSLLVVPASLIGNWRQELARFAPQLKVFFAHRSECEATALERVAKRPERALAEFDLVVTTYTLVKKLPWLTEMTWRLAALDEAQAIKNAGSAQTRAVKRINASARIVLTGTPVENQLGDLWSLFDFCCPGLLGSPADFKAFLKRLGKQPEPQAFGPLRRLVQPYILRRLKTDPRIVPDLPAKTEMRTECGLSKKQAALYRQTVDELARQLQLLREQGRDQGIQRRGIVLATTMRLKQICNHPAQYLGQSEYAAAESGKFGRLAEVCEPIASRQEKLLVFTQFKTLCEPLARHLAVVFGHAGLVLHGGVPVGRRTDLVRRFQEDEAVPFFVISVKAGGTGLNLTAASHVVHFDRWWNPAVENQATDRAFRIGQKRNVLVHKFVCRGTLEERIDEMIRTKQDLADQILGGTAAGETLLTEMSDAQLLSVLTLDITRAADET